MGKIKVRHLRVKASGFYFEPSSLMKAAGFRAEALGMDLAVAVARCNELNAEWDAIRIGGDKKPELSPKGTMARLIEDLLTSSAYRDKSAARQNELDYSIKEILPIFGPAQLTRIMPEQCEKFYDNLREQGSVHKAARIVKDLRYLFNRAIKQRTLVHNPAHGFAVKQPPPRQITWTEDQVVRVIDLAWKEGFHGISVAITIMYDTSLRPGDVRALTVGQIGADRVILTVAKTNTEAMLPLWDETVDRIRRYLAEMDATLLPSATLIRTRFGRPYGEKNFINQARRIMRKAGIPDAYQLRDIRRTAMTERADAGSTIAEIATSGQHSIRHGYKTADTYIVPSFNRAKTAQDKRREHKARSKVGNGVAG